MHEVSAYLGIGANLVPDGYDNLLEALEAAIAQIEEVTPIIQRSGWYRTAPVPVSDQPDFLNAVLGVASDKTPHEFLREVNKIEARFGRVRSVRNAARVLDIDILFFGRQVIADAQLEIPHPRLHERAFVLRPLMEIAADFRHPENGLVIDTLYQNFLASPEGAQECLPL